MTTTATETKNPPNSTLARTLFEFSFRRGTKKPEFSVFEYENNLNAAIAKARSFCDEMNYTFCGCSHFIIDLDIVLKKHKSALQD